MTLNYQPPSLIGANMNSANPFMKPIPFARAAGGVMQYEYKSSKPKKQVNPIEEIVSALDEDYNTVLTQARENVGDDLVKLREEVLRLDGMSQSNYAVIIKEIDKY